MEPYHTQPDYEGLQAKVEYAGLHPVPMHDQPQYLPQGGQPQPQYQFYGDREPISKICGLRRTTFWLVLLLILVLMAAVAAGTVGGVLGSQKANSTM